MAIDDNGNYVIDVPLNGCYLDIQYPDLFTSSFFVKFVSSFNDYIFHEYTEPSPYNVGFSDNFQSISLEENLSMLPTESLYQFYNNCNVAFNEEFYAMTIDQKREYLTNVGLNPTCWNEDYFYFTPNNLVNTLLSMAYQPFNIFYHNYFIKVENVYFSFKEPESATMQILPPIDGKQNIIIEKFVSRKRSRFETNPSRYELYPMEFSFDIEPFFDITEVVDYDFEIDPYTMYQYLNRDTYKVFPPLLEERINPDGTIYNHEMDSLELILYRKFFTSFDGYGPYQDLKKLFPYQFGFFNGFMIFSLLEKHYANYFNDEGIEQRRFSFSRVTYKRILTTKYFVDNNGQTGDSFQDVVSGSQTLNPNPPKKIKCCLAECFGITE